MTRPNPNVSSVFADALACETPQQLATLLEDACGSNAEMRRQVERLLAAHHQANGFLGSATADVVDPSIAVGKVIGGRYKLLEAIGEGGMGTVWVAEQTEPVRRKVALKLVKAGMDSKQVLVRFQAERQALALMDHPNIAKVLDGGVTDSGRPFFAMEYVKGVPITNYCDDCHLPLRERLKLFVSVCQAVQHAHQKGIIHRDLKPSNILVCQYDGLPVVKVIDFGLAKAVNQPLTTQTLHTAHGIMIGTPLYMSPEQAEFNNLDVDTRTDIYSLGVVLYELLTGSTPIEKQQIQRAALDELLRLIKEVEPAKPSTRLSTSARLPSVAAQRGIDPKQLGRLLKGDLDWIVMKSLEKDRGRRYETANGMARDIERFLTDEAVEACPPSARYRLRKLMQRYRGPLLGASAVVAALVVGMVATTLAMFEARHQTRLAEVAAIEEGQARERAERAELRANEQLEVARAEQARADGETARAVAANNFMRNLLGPPSAGAPGDTLEIQDRRVSDVIAAAGAAIEGLEQQPQLELDGRLTLASTYAAIGELDKAKSQYKRAAQLSRELHGAQSDATLQIEIDYLFAGQTSLSKQDLALAQRLVDTLTERHGADHPMTCDARNSLGLWYQNQEDFDEAIKIYRSIVDSVRRHPDEFHPKGAARYVFNLANVLRFQGEKLESERLMIEACAICDREPHTDPGRCLQYYVELGKVHVRSGRLEQGMEAWEVALQRSAPLGMTPVRASLIDKLIALSGQLEQYDRTQGYVRKLQEAFEQGGFPEGKLLYEPLSHVLLAETMFRSGKDEAAQELLAEATALLRKRVEADPSKAAWYAELHRIVEFGKRGARATQAWPSPALGSAAEIILQQALARHATTLDSPPFEWDQLTIDLVRWEGPDVDVSAPAFHGTFAELSRFDPPEGLYMLVIDLPRTGTFAAREVIWFLESNWDLAFYDGDELKLDQGDPWEVLAKAIPFKQRRGPVAAWEQITQFESFAGYHLTSNLVAAARTEAILPPGPYYYSARYDGEITLWVDGVIPEPAQNFEFGLKSRELKFIWQKGAMRCCPFIEPRGPAKDRLQNRAIPPLHWVQCEMEVGKAAVARNPGDAASIIPYARLLCRLGEFEQAYSQLKTLENQLPNDHYVLYQFATLAAYRGDHETYRQICRKLLDNYSEFENSVELGERSAKCCLLLPEEISHFKPGEVASRVNRTAQEPPGVNAPWYHMVQGLHQFRLGEARSTGAIKWLDRSITAFGGRTPPSVCYFVRAMALKQNGQEAEAAEAYRKAEEYHAGYAGVPGRDDLGTAFENWLIDEIFAREARAMFAAAESSVSP